MALTIYSYPNNKNSQKGLIAAEYVGVKVELAKDFQFGVTNKTPEFVKMNPIGKVPVLETPEGAVFESNAIARYIAGLGEESALLGTTLIEKAHVDQWIFFSSNEIDRHTMAWLVPLLGIPGYQYNQLIENNSIQAVKRALCCLNAYLATNTYLVADMVTVADIVVACDLIPGFKFLWGKDFTAEFPHVVRYFFTLVNQPEFVKVLGEIKQTEAPLKREVKAKEPKVKKEEPKKEKPKKPEPAKQVEVAKAKDEEDEEDVPPPPKKVNPLDLLPPSSMKLDDWKRLYSNTKAAVFREVAIKGFWDMYDPEGYSLWFCDYKYNEENMVNFVTMNKVSGFLQRMELINKYGFAKMCILGDTPPYQIRGVWLFRGKEIPQRVKDECYDVELFDWKQVDINDEAQKNLVSDMFEETDTIAGAHLLECKCFK